MKLFRATTALLFLLLSAATLPAGIDIPRDMWQPNQDPGYCGWVSMKTLMLYGGWDVPASRVVKDEAEHGARVVSYQPGPFGQMTPVTQPAGGCTPEKVDDRLGQYRALYGLEYEQLYPVAAGSRPDEARVATLRRAIKDGLGAVVSVQHGKHAVVLVDVGDKTDAWSYVVNGKKVRRHEHTVKWIDSNDVRDYNNQMDNYIAGFRDTAPARPKLHEESLEWWVNNDWDGWAVIIKPNEKVLAARKAAAAKTALVKHVEKNEGPRQLAPPVPPPIITVPQPPQPHTPASKPEEPAQTDDEPEDKKKSNGPKEKTKKTEVAKVPLTDISPIIAPMPPAASIKPPAPTFPRAQPQALVMPFALTQKTRDQVQH